MVTAVGGQVVLGPSQLVMTFVRDSSIIDLTLCHPSETNNKKFKAGEQAEKLKSRDKR